MSNSADFLKEYVEEQTFLKAGIQKYLGMILHHLAKRDSPPTLWQLYHLHEALAWLERKRYRFALSDCKSVTAKNVHESSISNAQASVIAKDLAGVSLESLRDAFVLIKRRTFHDYPRVISTGKRIPMSKGC